MKRGNLGEWLAAREALASDFPALGRVDLESVADGARGGGESSAAVEGVTIHAKRLNGAPPPPERLERHGRYADLHLVLEGREEYWLADSRGLVSLGPFDEAEDVEWYAPAACERLTLTAGDWIFIEPGLAHMGGLAPDAQAEGGPIVKLVLKIPRA